MLLLPIGIGVRIHAAEHKADSVEMSIFGLDLPMGIHVLPVLHSSLIEGRLAPTTIGKNRTHIELRLCRMPKVFTRNLRKAPSEARAQFAFYIIYAPNILSTIYLQIVRFLGCIARKLLRPNMIVALQRNRQADLNE